MAQKRKNPAGEGGVRRRLAERLDTPDYNTLPTNIKHRLRLSRLQRWHGLSGSRAALVAALAFGEGVR